MSSWELKLENEPDRCLFSFQVISLIRQDALTWQTILVSNLVLCRQKGKSFLMNGDGTETISMHEINFTWLKCLLHSVSFFIFSLVLFY